MEAMPHDGADPREAAYDSELEQSVGEGGWVR
jgi:hypothetical protein